MKFPFLGKQKRQAIMPAPSRVASLSSQGFSESDVITTMRSEGYSPIEIDRSLKMAVKSQAGRPLRTPIEERDYPAQQYSTPRQPVQAQPVPSLEDDMPLPGEPYSPKREIPEFESFQPRLPELPELPKMNFRAPSEFDDEKTQGGERLKRHETVEKTRIEEIAEGIIQEKWQSFDKHSKEIGDRMLSLSARMDTIENAVNQLKSSQRGEIEQIKSSVLAYRQGMDEMSSKLESIDKSMKDSLTPMLQTLRSMSDTIRTIKKKPA